MAQVEHRVTGDGTHEIGVVIHKAFVPFARLDADRVGALVENARNRGDVQKDNAKKGEKGGEG